MGETLRDRVAMLECLVAERDRLYTERDVSRHLATTAAFAASEKAIAKAEANADKWRENANEWRAAMMDREVRFATRSETESEFRNLRAEIASLAKSRDERSGSRTGATDLRAWIVAAVSLLIAGLTLARLIVR